MGFSKSPIFFQILNILPETPEVVWFGNIKQPKPEPTILDKFKQPHKSGIYIN
jgi:hypothetical protein